jgi:hypothetical protein
MVKKSKKITNENLNVYEHLPKALIPHYINPSYNDHLFSLPFRCICVGASGSGKTQVVVNFIHRAKDTFNHIVVCCANKDEPLYNYLTLKIDPEQYHMYEGIHNIPTPEDLAEQFEKDDQILIVFDDLVIEKKQAVIESYFIRGRKICGGISCFYASQSYFGVPKMIRLQCSYILLKKLSTQRDLKFILSDFNLGIDQKILLQLYKYCTEEPNDFLTIAVQDEVEKRWRKNWTEIIDMSKYTED